MCHLTKEELESMYKNLKERRWKVVVDEEINQIVKNNTWSLVLASESCKSIGLRWVFKIKKESTKQLTKHKARSVVKGYAQRYGIDFTNVFAP